jgi:probable rRNA maturation factor
MLVHGMLHLLGFDHRTDDEARQMEALEIAALARRGVKNPYKIKRLN